MTKIITYSAHLKSIQPHQNQMYDPNEKTHQTMKVNFIEIF